jgi:hypothetical protein
VLLILTAICVCPSASSAQCDLGSFCSITQGDLLGSHEQPTLRPQPLAGEAEQFVSFAVRKTTPGFESVREIWLERNQCAPFVVPLDARRRPLLADPTGALSYVDPAWSPDGRYLAYVETNAPMTSARILIQEFVVRGTSCKP